MPSATSQSAAPPSSSDDITYTFHPSLMGAQWVFTLTSEGLRFQAGRRSGTWAYRDIASIRLLYRPLSIQANRYLAEIRTFSGDKVSLASTSWQSVIRIASQAEEYRTFLTALHARVAAAGRRADYIAGQPMPLHWIGLTVSATLIACLGVLLFRAAEQRNSAALLILILFAAVGGWQFGSFIWRNRPGRYNPAHLPAHLIPTK